MCSLRKKALNQVRRLVKSKPVKLALYSILLVGCQKHTVVSRNYADPSTADKLTPPTTPSVIQTIAPAAPGNYNASLLNFLAHIPTEKITEATQQLARIFEDYSLPKKSFENYAHTSLLDQNKQKQLINFLTDHSMLVFKDYFKQLVQQKLGLTNVNCRMDFQPVDSEKMKTAISEEYFLGEYPKRPQWEALPYMVPNFKSGDYEITLLEENKFIFKWSTICSSSSDVVAQLLSGYYMVNLSTYSLESRFENLRPYFIQSIDKMSASPLDQLHINSNVNKDFKVQEIVPEFSSFFLSYSR